MIRKKIHLALLSIGLFFISSLSFAYANPLKDHLAQYNQIKDINIVATDNEGYERIDFTIEQPLDHSSPSTGSLKQHVVILTKDSTSPVVLETHGYGLYYRDWLSGLSNLVSGNQVRVEHRYFGNSKPDNPDWQHLNIENAANDIHKIVNILKPYFTGKWLSTGSSKGGMTATYHRYFHPGDVDGTIANVAPLSYGKLDFRYPLFMSKVHTAECRNRIIEYQRMLLANRYKLVPMLEAERIQRNDSFTQFETLENALDAMIAEFYFSFFQYQDADNVCEFIPTSDTDLDFAYRILSIVSSPWGLISDNGIKSLESFYYQAYTQLGYYSHHLFPIYDLLQSNPNDYHRLLTQDYIPRFDYYAMPRITHWARWKSKNIMFIYGDNDPWSAGAYPIRNSHKRSTWRFDIAGANHFANLFSLNTNDRAIANDMIEQWLGISLPEVTPLVAQPSALSLRSSENKTPSNMLALRKLKSRQLISPVAKDNYDIVLIKKPE